MRRAVVWITAALILAVPPAASALDGGGGAWEPGRMLVRFRPGVGAAERRQIAHRAGAGLEQKLPLVPNLWELETTRNVETTVSRLDAESGVEYAQPNYVDNEPDQGGQDSVNYWPSDPYFWPTKFGNPNGCKHQQAFLSGWPLWPLGQNLTDSSLAAATFNPVPFAQRMTTTGGRPSLSTYDSINVMPVWNLLGGRARLGGPDGAGWTTEQIQRYGVGVIDEGIANHPDLSKQVAAEFSVVDERAPANTNFRTEVQEVHRDDAARDDMTAVRAKLPQVEDNNRPLFALDDATNFGVDEGAEAARLAGLDHPGPPTGCDGHGTAVASLVTARGGNGVGTVGAAYNVPVVALRQGMPWDARHSGLASDQKLNEAISTWKTWERTARFTDADRIDLYAIAAALNLPVINMSYGGQMVAELPDARGREHLVVENPAGIEALARVLSTGTTLGVTAAGNNRERYGSGPTALGARFYRLNAHHGPALDPCGLKLIPQLKVWTLKWVGNPAKPVAEAPYVPDPAIDWKKIELLCVAATTSAASKLAQFSAYGDAAVELAAPGESVTVATRPAAADPGGATAYATGHGTSYSAPLVAGAAALLRRAAPGAPIDMIRRALEQGARTNLGLRGKVLYGSLDVACSLRWLDARRQPEWDMISIASQPDPKAYADFIASTSACGRRPAQVSEERLEITKSQLLTRASFGSVGSYFSSVNPADGFPNSVARRWQDQLLAETGIPSPAAGTAFPIGAGGFARPLSPVQLSRGLPVYDAGLLTVGCPGEGYVITGLDVAFANVIRPLGWVFPTGAEPPTKNIQLAVGVAQPWYWSFVDSKIVVRARAICQYFTQVTQ